MLFLMDLSKWYVAAAHFAERHALIIIIALGEAIISIGIGIEGLPLDVDVIIPILLGLIVIIALWWAYFDKNMSIVEKHAVELRDLEQTVFAQRAYTYLHLPMIIGLIFFSLGVKKSVGHPHDVLNVVASAALCGGLMLNLTAQICFLYMATKQVGYIRLTAVFSLGVLLFFSCGLESLVVLILCSGIMVTLVIIEALVFKTQQPIAN